MTHPRTFFANNRALTTTDYFIAPAWQWARHFLVVHNQIVANNFNPKLKRMRPILHTLLLAALLFLNASNGTAQNSVAINLTGDQHREALNFDTELQVVKVCGLKPGKSYQVWAGKPGCHPMLKLVGNAADYSTTATFQASASCMEFLVKKDQTSPSCAEGTVWFSIGCKDCAKKGTDPFSKIATQPVLNPQTLLDDIFLGGECYEVSNLNAIGASIGRGSFNDGNSTIGITEGVILSTGNIALAAGPNNNDQEGYYNGGPISDPDLDIYANNNIFDVQGLEFDFIPTSTSVSFEYVFASEEYCEFVNAGVSDLFGFFISGPGINGGFSFNGQNIALVPNTNLYVSVDNINQFDNALYFVPNRPNCGATTNMTDIQFDGWTSVLTATATVVPCEKYHIRLVIADFNDGIFDSAIFLGAGTFNAGGDPELGNIQATTGTEVAIEACDPAAFTFVRAADSDITKPLPIDINILPSSTATVGLDYVAFPLSIVIPPGQNSITLPLNILADNIAEGTETINISITNNCDCTLLEFGIEINDPPVISVTLPTVVVCEGNSTTVQAAPLGGLAGSIYTFLWSNGQTGSSINITPIDNEVISVTVTDQCSTTASDSTIAQVIEIPEATLTVGGGNNCIGSANDSLTLTIELTGEPDWLLNYTLNGQAQQPLLATASPYLFTTSMPGIYEFTGVTTVNGNCAGPATGGATIFIGDVQNLVQTTPITCASTSSMTISTTGGTTPYNYVWSNGSPNAPSASGLPPGDYTVTVSDANGCSSLATGTISIAPTLSATAAGSQVNCTAPNSGTITLDVTGGTAPFTYTWSGGLPSTQNQTGLSADVYTVTVNDAGGCSTIASATVTATSVAPAAAASANADLNCNVMSINVLGQGSETGSNINYLWTGPGIVGANNTLNIVVETAGSYTLLVTNTANGCTATASTSVLADETQPIAVAEGGILTCADTTISLNGNGSSIGQNFVYQWSGTGIVAGGNTLNPTVNEAGNYTLTVTNQTNGCTASDTVSVGLNETMPSVVIAPVGQLNCNANTVSLNGSGSSTGTNFSYQWLQNGSVLPNETSPVLITNSSGTYQLIVSNALNGCTASSNATVTQNLTFPVAGATANGQLNCTQNSIALTGTVQGNPADFSFSWSTPNGVFGSSTNTQNTVATGAGTYFLEVTNIANGCIDSAMVQVTQSIDLPVVNIVAADNLDCNTSAVQIDATGSSQGTGISFTWSTINGSFLSGQNSLTPTVDAAGTYILSILDTNNNCQSLGSVTVTSDDAVPTIVFSAPPLLDCGTNQVALQSTVGNVPANASISYSWSTIDGVIVGQTNLDSLLVSAPGNYILLVENEATGCIAQATEQVAADLTAPLAIIAPADPITCTVSTVTLDGTGSSLGNDFTYQWMTIGGGFSSSTALLNPVVNAGGTYNLLITNELNHCTASEQVTVLENTEQPNALANAVADLTCDVLALNLSGSGSSEGGAFVYEWTGPGILQNGNTLSPLVNEPGTYQLLVSNQANGCSAMAAITVGENVATPLAEAGTGGTLSCQLTSLTLNGSGSSIGAGYVYEWTSPNGSILSGADGLQPIVNAPGDYLIAVTDTTNGCTATDMVQITAENDLPDVVIAQAPAITCIVGEVTLDGTGTATGADYTFLWYTVDGFIFNGETTLYPTVTEPGTYQLSVTNTTTNCTNTATVTVLENTSLPAAAAGQNDQLNCTETTLILNGSGSATGPGITYFWTTLDGNILIGDNTISPTIDEPGTYLLQVTNAATGCTNTDQVTIDQDLNTPIAAAAAPDTLDCTTISFNLNGNGSDVGGGFTYQWTSLDGNILSGATTLVPLINEPGIYTLTVTNSANHCTQTAAVVVNQDITSPLAVAWANGLITCTNNMVSLNSTGSSLGNNFSYQWSTINGNIISGINSQTPLVNEAGTYLLTISNTVNGCSATDEATVLENTVAPQAAIADPDILTCLVEEITLQASVLLVDDLSFQWTTINGQILVGDTTLAPVVNQPGEYLLTITNNDNGCTGETQTTVFQDITTPNADAGDPFVMGCNGQNSTLDGSGSSGAGAMTYAWNTNDGLLLSGIDSASPTIGQPGTYELHVALLTNGCTDTDAVTVTLEGPLALPQVEQPLCFGDAASIDFSNTSGGLPPYAFSVNGGATFSTQPVFTNLAVGTYQLVVQDANGCSFESEAIVEQPTQLSVEVTPEATIGLGESYQIQATVNIPQADLAFVEWTPSNYLSCTDCLNPLATPFNTISYTISVEDKNGCEDQATILIIVKKSNDVYVPNAFSPNDDGINDVFMVFSNLDLPVKVNSFLVFSRWGESVFQQFDFLPNDPNYGWNGWHRGEPMDPAVFAWYAEVEFIDGSTKLLKGDVTLVK